MLKNRMILEKIEKIKTYVTFLSLKIFSISVLSVFFNFCVYKCICYRKTSTYFLKDYYGKAKIKTLKLFINNIVHKIQLRYLS